MIQYLQRRVAETMSEFDYTPRVPNTNQQVETIIALYLIHNKYVPIIRSLINEQNLPEDRLKLQQVLKRDAEIIVSAFKDVWEQVGNCEAPSHVTIIRKKQYDVNLKEHTKNHRKIRRELLNWLKNQPVPNVEQQLKQLLCLSYWLMLFYTEKNRRNHKDEYNIHLHHFLSDLLVIFLLLLSELFPEENTSSPDGNIGGIVETTHGIIDNFPENPIFVELVLEEICKILDLSTQNNANPGSVRGFPKERVPKLAELAYEYFKNEDMIKHLPWATSERLCKIISDHARYMVPEDKTKRNFVVHKTMRSTVQGIECSSNQKGSNDQHKLIVNCAAVMAHSRDETLDVNVPLFKTEKINKEIKKKINIFHHKIHVGLVLFILEDAEVPEINSQYRIKVKNFMDFSRKVVRDAILWFRNCTGLLPKTLLNIGIAHISQCVKEIIVCRCQLTRNFYKGGIIPTDEHEQHKNVLIHLIAFRTLMMYLLPKNPYKFGEQQVAERLPQYAENVDIPL